MKFKLRKVLFITLWISLLTGCLPFSNQLITNRYAEAVFTKNNELEFRFKINEHLLRSEQPFKVKVSIHNQELAEALGTDEIIYGEEVVYSGEYLEANGDGEQIILMAPVSLKKDLHPFDIEKMIVNDQAISVEVFNDEQVLGSAYLTNFSTQL